MARPSIQSSPREVRSSRSRRSTYTVELDGTAQAFGTADSIEDEPRFTVHARYEAEHCVVDLPNAGVYL
jgi:hypothetical protein